MRITKKCNGCGELFRKTELTAYTTLSGKTTYNFCPECLKARLERDTFSEKVCAIFGLKSPGPRIYTERQRIQEKYGYTDDIIVQTLDYLYNVKKLQKLSDTLALVTPQNVNEMIKYRTEQKSKAEQLAQLTAGASKNEAPKPIYQPPKPQRTSSLYGEGWLDPDDFLDEDEFNEDLDE